MYYTKISESTVVSDELNIFKGEHIEVQVGDDKKLSPFTKLLQNIKHLLWLFG